MEVHTHCQLENEWNSNITVEVSLSPSIERAVCYSMWGMLLSAALTEQTNLFPKKCMLNFQKVLTFSMLLPAMLLLGDYCTNYRHYPEGIMSFKENVPGLRGRAPHGGQGTMPPEVEEILSFRSQICCFLAQKNHHGFFFGGVKIFFSRKSTISRKRILPVTSNSHHDHCKLFSPEYGAR